MKDNVRVVSPKFKTVREATEWMEILHWSYSMDSNSVIYGIKKETENNENTFVVVEIYST